MFEDNVFLHELAMLGMVTISIAGGVVAILLLITFLTANDGVKGIEEARKQSARRRKIDNLRTALNLSSPNSPEEKRIMDILEGMDLYPDEWGMVQSAFRANDPRRIPLNQKRAASVRDD